MRSLTREEARDIARAEIQAAETQWRSQDDGALSLQVLLHLIENRVTAVLAGRGDE